MISTQILLSGETGYESIDLYKDENIDIVAAVADVRNISNRNSTFTKQISFPATANNNTFFNHIFEIGSDSTFNPNKKTPSIITVDSIPVIEQSYFQLTDIILDYSNNIAEYKGTIYANNFDFFKQMGSKTIDELDWSGIDWQLNHTNIEASWISDWTNGIVYPLVDRNYGYATNGGILYSKVEEYHPCIYEKYLLNKIFDAAGFTYQSTFLDSAYFKNFIIEGCVNTSRKVDYNLHLDFGLVYLDITTSFCIWEAQLVLEHQSGAIEVLATKTEDWDASMGSYHTLDFTGTATVQTNDKIYVRFIFWDFLKMAYLETHFGGDCILTLDYQDTTTGDMEVRETAVHHYNYTTPVQYVTIEFPTVISDPDLTWNGTTTHTVPNFITANSYIKTNIKQSDYFTWLINRFNLYVDVDSIVPNRLIIEPRQIYYDNNTGTTKDWTLKLDEKHPVEVKLLSELQDKQITFTYKQDSDKLNNTYKQDEKRIYGDEVITFDNDFLTSEKKIEIGFSPTPLQNVAGSTEIIVPTIYPEQTGSSDFTYNIRSLYWGGLLPLPFDKISIQYAPSTYGTYTNQPYAGELDNPIYPTFSIMYGSPNFIFYNNNNPTGLYPNADLYSTYWRDWIMQISDKNSKLITAYFNLSPTDIQQLKFSDKIHFNTQDYIINKYYYNALGNTTTKVELLKIEPVTPAALDDKKKGAKMGRARNGITIGKDNTVTNSSLIIGDGNAVSTVTNALITGDGNSLNKTSHNIQILGDGNLVSSSANTVFVSGAENTILSKTNYINIIGGTGNTIDNQVNNLVLLNVSNYSATTASTNTVIANQVYVQSGLTASTIFTNTINGAPYSSFNSFLPLSGGTLNGETVFNSGLTVHSGMVVNTGLAKLVNYSASTADFYIAVDTSTGLNVYLPHNPANGQFIMIGDIVGSAAINNFKIFPPTTADTIQNTVSITVATNYQTIMAVYYAALNNWHIISSR